MVENFIRNNRAIGGLAFGGMLGLSLALAGPVLATDTPAGAPAGVAPVTATDIPSGTAAGTGTNAAPNAAPENAGAPAGEAAAAPEKPYIGPSAKPADIPTGAVVPKATALPIPPPAPTLAELPAIQIPPEVAQAAIDENPAGDAKVRDFLVADHSDAQLIEDRARALVRDLFNNPAAQDKFLDISQRVAELTGNVVKEVAGGQIQKVAVDKRYLPGPNDKAVKFGAADTSLPSGFELLTPQDPRLKGVNMRVIGLAQGDPMTGSGIVGVRSFQIDVPSGDYRVILLTADSGQPDTAEAPFGAEVTVNSVAQKVALSDPNKWTGNGTLSTPPAAAPAPSGTLPGAPPATDTLPGTNNQGGVTTHQANGSGAGGGGAIVVTTHVDNNRLDVSFTPPSDKPNQQTFIVGMIAESTTHPSGLQGVINPLDVQNAIMGDATSLFNPQAGGPGQGGGPGAILDPQGTTTPPSYQNGVPPGKPPQTTTTPPVTTTPTPQTTTTPPFQNTVPSASPS
ncbi:MAG: hypothetical protein ACHQRJ_09655 [Alphaproteobacteria bacterium]